MASGRRSFSRACRKLGMIPDAKRPSSNMSLTQRLHEIGTSLSTARSVGRL